MRWFIQKFCPFKKRLFASTLRKRIMALFTLCMLLPSIIALFFMYNPILSLIVDEYAASLRSSVSDFSRLADNYLSQVKYFSTTLYSSQTYIDLLKRTAPVSSESYNSLISSAHMIFINNQEIQLERLYMINRSSVWSVNRADNMLRDYTFDPNTEVVAQYDPDGALYRLSSLQSCGSYDASQPIMRTTQYITDVPRDNLLAVFTAELSGVKLDALLSESSMYEHETLYLIGDDLSLYYLKGADQFTAQALSQLTEGLTPGANRVTFSGMEYLVCAHPLENHALSVLRIVPLRELTQRARGIIARTLALYLALSAATLLAGLLLSDHIIRPINLLITSMRRMERGHFGEHITITSSDAEIDSLVQRYNAMTDQIKRLFDETYKLRILQQEAEFKALQSQINPHFLYNTLQAIHGMALERNAFEINLMVDALSNILKYCLRGDSSIVPLSRELEMIDQYLTIQQLRFIDRLRVELDIDPSSRDFLMPKMTLQPLVENSIQHGFQNTDQSCRVRVRTLMAQDGLHIEIEDDGAGMQPATLQAIRESLEREDSLEQDAGHIGIRNCLLRLKFYFGGSVSMRIDSAPDQGTRILIRVLRGKE